MSRIILSFAVAVLLAGTLACGRSGPTPVGLPIKSGSAGNNMTVTLSSPDGVLRDGDNSLILSFTDQSGAPVEVGAASLNFHMPAMGTMPTMNDAATLTTTTTGGIYNAKVKLQMAGEWQAQIAYEGPAGKGKVTLPMTAQ